MVASPIRNEAVISESTGILSPEMSHSPIIENSKDVSYIPLSDGAGDVVFSDTSSKPTPERTSLAPDQTVPYSTLAAADAAALKNLPRLNLKPSPSASAAVLESFSLVSTPTDFNAVAKITANGKVNGNGNGTGNGNVTGNSNGNGNGVLAPMDHPMVVEAWEWLEKSYVYFKGVAVGTVAASDPSVDALNYNQVFVRDFFPSALACLLKQPPNTEIVKNFLLKTLHLQSREKKIDKFTLGEGVMPASFNVALHEHLVPQRYLFEALEADFGGTAIGRVAPIDSGFWWILLLKTYTKATSSHILSEMPEVQKGIKLILDLCLSDGFDTFPTLLCADACCMIDRRMGIYGYPIEIQALFYFALRAAEQMLKDVSDNKEILGKISEKIKALSYHIRTYYWLDHTQLNNIYRYRTEEYSHTAVNKFNVSPESIPDWLFDFMPLRGGYFVGNVSPARMDFRWFLLGNCMAILSSLATQEQENAIMDLIEERWDELIGLMPLKITYPALENHEWRIVTGYDSKNTPWSYHNGGSWPVLIWLLTSACIKAGRPQLAKNAVELVEARLFKDGWPEYYDGKTGLYVGKQARKYQTWSIAGYLVAKLMLENPANVALVSLSGDKDISKPKLTRSASWS